jgi:DedD protein
MIMKNTSMDASADAALAEKKRARRRLIGALVLVLSSVIFLPRIFDVEQKSAPDNIEIHIPSAEPSASTISSAPVKNASASAVVSATTNIDLSLDKEEVIVNNNETHAVNGKKNEVVTNVESKPKSNVAENNEVAPFVDEKGSKYVVQVAALESKSNIKELQNKLQTAGIASYMQTVTTESGERIRLRVGPFKTKEEAEKARDKVNKLNLSSVIVPLSVK